MKFRGERASPASVALWLERQIIRRGLDRNIFVCIIKLMQQEQAAGINAFALSEEINDLKRSVVKFLIEAPEFDSLVDELKFKLKDSVKCLKEKNNSENLPDIADLNRKFYGYSALWDVVKEAAMSQEWPIIDRNKYSTNSEILLSILRQITDNSDLTSSQRFMSGLYFDIQALSKPVKCKNRVVQTNLLSAYDDSEDFNDELEQNIIPSHSSLVSRHIKDDYIYSETSRSYESFRAKNDCHECFVGNCYKLEKYLRNKGRGLEDNSNTHSLLYILPSSTNIINSCKTIGCQKKKGLKDTYGQSMLSIDYDTYGQSMLSIDYDTEGPSNPVLPSCNHCGDQTNLLTANYDSGVAYVADDDISELETYDDFESSINSFERPENRNELKNYKITKRKSLEDKSKRSSEIGQNSPIAESSLGLKNLLVTDYNKEKLVDDKSWEEYEMEHVGEIIPELKHLYFRSIEYQKKKLEQEKILSLSSLVSRHIKEDYIYSETSRSYQSSRAKIDCRECFVGNCYILEKYVRNKRKGLEDNPNSLALLPSLTNIINACKIIGCQKKKGCCKGSKDTYGQSMLSIDYDTEGPSNPVLPSCNYCGDQTNLMTANYDSGVAYVADDDISELETYDDFESSINSFEGPENKNELKFKEICRPVRYNELKNYKITKRKSLEDKSKRSSEIGQNSPIAESSLGLKNLLVTDYTKEKLVVDAKSWLENEEEQVEKIISQLKNLYLGSIESQKKKLEQEQILSPRFPSFVNHMQDNIGSEGSPSYKSVWTKNIIRSVGRRKESDEHKITKRRDGKENSKNKTRSRSSVKSQNSLKSRSNMAKSLDRGEKVRKCLFGKGEKEFDIMNDEELFLPPMDLRFLHSPINKSKQFVHSKYSQPISSNFIRCGTNIKSSIWTTEQMDEDDNSQNINWNTNYPANWLIPSVSEVTNQQDLKANLCSDNHGQFSLFDNTPNRFLPTCLFNTINKPTVLEPLKITVNEEENLFLSSKTHFTPIKEKQASPVNYEDGYSFSGVDSFEEVNYIRNRDGHLSYQGNTFMDFKRTDLTYPTEFVPKFRVIMTDKSCQTDDLPPEQNSLLQETAQSINRRPTDVAATKVGDSERVYKAVATSCNEEIEVAYNATSLFIDRSLNVSPLIEMEATNIQYPWFERPGQSIWSTENHDPTTWGNNNQNSRQEDFTRLRLEITQEGEQLLSDIWSKFPPHNSQNAVLMGSSGI